MRTLGKMLLCIVTAILPGCTLQYPIVGIAKNYNEVFRGTVTANPWTGHAFVDVQALVTKVRCAGSARVTYAPATGSVSGQMGAGVLNCEDGRAVQASYTITGLAGGFGTGRDQFGNNSRSVSVCQKTKQQQQPTITLLLLQLNHLFQRPSQKALNQRRV